MKIRGLGLCIAAIVVALATHIAPGPTPAASGRTLGPSFAADAIQTAASAAELARLIGAFESRAKDHTDSLDLTFLAKLYLQRARSTGDLGSYTQAGEALTRALALAPDDPDARAVLARLRYATHDFAGARDIAASLFASDPTDPGAAALLGDAALEVGDYAAASQRFEALSRAFPGAAAVDARLARLSFVTGDPDAARDRAARANAEARAEGAFGVDLAWYAHLEAQVGFDRGDYEAAAASEREALAIAPGYHVAEAGLARAMAALGQTAEAIAWYGRAIDAMPQPDYLAALGDLYAISGEAGRATNAYDTVEAGATLSPSSARLYDRQLALFYLDHDRHLDRALTIAEAALGQRPDVYGYDIYAWSLYKAGRYDEAAAASDRALGTGAPDARFHYHAGYIALARGDAARAKAELGRALAIGPAFDPILAGRARTMLAWLEALG